MRAAVIVVILLCCSGVAAAHARAQTGAVSNRGGGAVMQPWEGERLTFCSAPELTVVLKVDSATAGATRFSMGTGALAPRTSNTSSGHGHDEIIFFVRGMGAAVVGTDSVPVHAGTTLYLPQGLRHAFINPSDGVLEFVWVVAPRGFEDGIRRSGVAPGTPCPAREASH